MKSMLQNVAFSSEMMKPFALRFCDERTVTHSCSRWHHVSIGAGRAHSLSISHDVLHRLIILLCLQSYIKPDFFKLRGKPGSHRQF